jgi:hypothetical protein
MFPTRIGGIPLSKRVVHIRMSTVSAWMGEAAIQMGAAGIGSEASSSRVEALPSGSNRPPSPGDTFPSRLTLGPQLQVFALCQTQCLPRGIGL